MNREKFMEAVSLELFFRWDVKVLYDIIYSLCIFLDFINFKYELRNDSCLISDPVAQRFSNFFLMIIKFGQQRFFVLDESHTDKYFRYTQIRTDAHFNNRDEVVGKNPPLISLKNIAQLFLNKPAEFLLSYCPAHAGKVKKERTLILIARINRHLTADSYYFSYLQTKR